MAASDWAELMGDCATKQLAEAEPAAKEAPAPRASSKAPPPGFDKPMDSDRQPAAAATEGNQPAAAGGDGKSFGGGNAALAALMGSAPPATSSAQVCSAVLFRA